MELQTVLAAFGLADAADVFAPEWEAAQAAIPPGELGFLTPDSIRSACAEVELAQETAEAAVSVAERVATSPPLRSLAWHMHYRLYRTRTADWDDVCGWPNLESVLGEAAGAFYLVVLLSGLPGMRQIHGAHGIPVDIIRDTIRDLKLWLDSQRADRPGLTPTNVAWLANHFRGDLYRLGRLQFQFGRFHYRIRVFRHLGSGLVLALSEDGVRYRKDGQIPVSEDDEGTWMARLAASESEVVGSPILPTGQAVRREVTLKLSEWRQVVARGDAVLNIHIPGGSPLRYGLSGDSVSAALKFFPRHFPDYQFAALCCGSWILNTWLETVLPETSNLLRFQREFYLFPIAMHTRTMVNRVFGYVPDDLKSAPRDTLLRRAIIDAVVSGKGFKGGGGGCFLLPDDFHWGSQIYRSQELPPGIF